MKIGFLFAGQGSQHPGMGKDFYEQYDAARRLYDSIDIDIPVKELCFNGTQEQLNDTAVAQPCILATSSAIAAVLSEKGIHADVAAGLSLGEYSALAYAGVFTPQEGAKLVRQRGKIMAAALPEGTSGMAAVLNTEESVIAEVCAEVKEIGVCEIANYNCPGQIVISGQKEAVAAASEKLKARGARRVIPLQVSGAFHTSLLNEASVQLREVLDTYAFGEEEIPVINNVSGKVETRDLREVLQEQICHSVHFTQSLQAMIDMGVELFIEIGPGHALSGFVRKTTKEVPVYHIDTTEDLEKVLKEVCPDGN
ncbi:MAG: ACP S-malonyltransferase [Merdibacter sp.]|nr:ACP S-malonyltransferase [Candidatus Merdibacter merdipullorum]